MFFFLRFKGDYDCKMPRKTRAIVDTICLFELQIIRSSERKKKLIVLVIIRACTVKTGTKHDRHSAKLYNLLPLLLVGRP